MSRVNTIVGTFTSMYGPINYVENKSCLCMRIASKKFVAFDFLENLINSLEPYKGQTLKITNAAYSSAHKDYIIRKNWTHIYNQENEKIF